MKALQKTAAAILLFVIMIAASAITASAASLNPSAVYDLDCGKIHKTYLEKTNDGFMRILVEEKQIIIEYYNSGFEFKSRKTLALELPLWGTFYNGSDSYYLVLGKENPENKGGAEVIRIIRYSKDWKKLSSASIKSVDNWRDEIGIPFDYSCVNCSETEDKLFIATGREGYIDPQYGQGHQGLLLISLDKKKMSAKIETCDFMHSFSQYIATEETKLYLYEESEGYRCTRLSTFDIFGSYIENAQSFAALKYGGTRTSAWEIPTYAHANGMALSSSSILGVDRSIDQSKYDTADNNTPLNIYLTVTPKKKPSEKGTKLIWITNNNKESFGYRDVRLTKINNNRFMISWSGYSEDNMNGSDLNDPLSNYFLHYVFVDGNGNKLSKEYKVGASISDCPMITDGSKVYYTASTDTAICFYTIDAFSGKLSKKVIRIAGSSSTWEFKDGTLFFSGSGSASIPCPMNRLYENIRAIAFRNGITNIPDNSFNWIKNTVSVSFADSVTKIGKKCFMYNENNTAFLIPASVKTIGEDSFWVGYKTWDGSTRLYYVTLCVTKGSAAETFAKNNYIKVRYDKPIDSFTVTIPKLTYDYTGSAVRPEVTVKDPSGNKLTKDRDYTVSYSNKINTGTAAVTVSGKGSYFGTATRRFTIKGTDISDAAITIPYSSYTYRGRGIKPTVTVTLKDKKLTKGTDFSVSYSNNTNIGTAKITVTGKGAYSGTLSKTFKVKTLGLTSSYAVVSVPYSAYTYSGKAIKPAVTVAFKDGDVIPADQYTLTYTNNVRVGVASIVIKGKGTNITGTYTKTFIVKPAKNDITSITSTKGAFKIKWTIATAGAIGYQVLYSQDKSALESAVGEIPSANVKHYVHSYTSTDLNDLSENFSKVPNSGETWYVKVRSFYTKDGKPTSTRYGNFSTVKSIKVK